MFRPVSAKPDVNQVEQAQLAFWHEHDIFHRTMEERRDGPRYVFYEGPPTANGKPGTHHILSRAFKDMFPRYKTMQGYYVLRKGGWDTHGLPVEIEVEKELGLKHKHEIEEFGIAEFNKKCKESVFRYIQEWEKLTERIAFWVDLDEAYVTFTNDYIQSVWWILRQFWDHDLLYQGYKVVPYCPRCGTPLASHEVNQGYKHTKDPSLYVRFRLSGQDDTYFLVWTTTPWTLPGNVALAVGEDIDYVLLEGIGADGKAERLYVAAALLTAAVEPPTPAPTRANADDDDAADAPDVDSARYDVVQALKAYQEVERVKGRDLLGMHYNPLFTFMPVEQDAWYVVKGDFVSTEDGTGIVHMAPAFGADDLKVGQEYDLPVLVTVGPDGSFIPEVAAFAGQWVKDADPEIIKDLEMRGLAFRHGKYDHRYPFCWRCDTALLYYARPTWFIRASSFREQLVGLNQTINWVPEHIREGRFGNWLAGNVDWALGRERYWGTPLPVWICDNPECGHMHCVGGVEELTEVSGQDQSGLDLHRPYVDEIVWNCAECDGKGTMRRVPELIDVWFDSGAMPVAQWGYPFTNREMFEDQFPANYICEAIDQTRGWFYSLHAISTMLFDSVSFENVICLGHILDENGQKMSKSKGNIVDPSTVLDAYGADTFRWYMYTAGPPGDPRRFSVNLVGESYRSFWLTLWNVYRLFVDYANLDGFNPLNSSVPVAKRQAMDRWILAELHALVQQVTQAFEDYDVTGATRPIASFVDDKLSNWYVRRSKQRLWRSEADEDKLAAYLTLYEVLVTLSKLLAPTMPFIADELYRNLVKSVDASAPDSVHLAQWPASNPELIDPKLIEDMALVMRLASLGLSARNSAGIKVRQPLAEAAFSVPEDKVYVVHAYADVLSDELNVKSISALTDAADVVSYSLNPLPNVLGPRFGKDFPALQKLLRESGEADEYARKLLARQTITVRLNGAEVEITPSEVEVRSNPVEGYAVAEDQFGLAAIRITLTPELEAEGLARDFIRRVQELRKTADYDVADRIVVDYRASSKLAGSIDLFSDLIRGETLAIRLEAVDNPTGDAHEEFAFSGESLAVAVRRA